MLSCDGLGLRKLLLYLVNVKLVLNIVKTKKYKVQMKTPE